MKPIDVAKAAGLAAVVLALDVLIAIAVVYGWAVLLAPGHPAAYYRAAAPRIALWSTRIIGTSLIFGAAWLAARRRPERGALAFAATLAVSYAILDGASVGFVGFFTLGIALTMTLKLFAALAGAQVARLRRRATPRALGGTPGPKAP